MILKTLNSEALFEKEMADLQKELEQSKKELTNDIAKRITLDKIKEFMKKWKNFIDKFDISKQRITVIEQKGKAILKFLRDKVQKLEQVEAIEMDEIKPMHDYLDNFADDIMYHVEIQKEKYAIARRR